MRYLLLIQSLYALSCPHGLPPSMLPMPDMAQPPKGDDIAPRPIIPIPIGACHQGFCCCCVPVMSMSRTPRSSA